MTKHNEIKTLNKMVCSLFSIEYTQDAKIKLQTKDFNFASLIGPICMHRALYLQNGDPMKKSACIGHKYYYLVGLNVIKVNR